MFESFVGGAFIIFVCVAFALLVVARLIWRFATGIVRIALLAVLGLLGFIFVALSGVAALFVGVH